MSSLLYLLGAATVGGILFATEGVPSSALSKSWATGVEDFFCKPGSGEYDPSFRIAGENFPAIVSVSLLFAYLTYKYARHTFVKILSCTAVIYSLTFAIIGYMRYTNVPEFKQICSQLAIRTESALLTEPKDLLAPFLAPLQFLPAKPFSNNSQVAHTYAIIYPHLGEYFLTIEPFLPYFFVLFAVWLEIKPLRNSFWHHLPVIGAILSFVIMAVSEQSDFINAEPKDLLLNTILQYAIYYLTTFVLLAIYVMLFRLGMRRISVVGLLLILSRLHILGLPKFEFHLEMLLFILLLSIMVVTCDFFPGTFLNFSLLAHYFSTYPPAGFEPFVGWTRMIETALIVMLISNAISQIGNKDAGSNKRRVKQKKE